MRAVLCAMFMSIGGCTCPPGGASCDGQCVDVGSSIQHCGGCYRRCDGLCEDGWCRETGCRTDADCDDGDTCNGREACDVDTCRRIEPPLECDDGLACTTDDCQASACTHTPDDERCPSGGVCQLDGEAPSGCFVDCALDPCDPIAECGCHRSSACYYGDGSLGCASPGSIGFGDPCESSADCRPRMGCFERSRWPDLVSARRCAAYCQSDADCGPGKCLADGPGALFGSCFRKCDLLDDDDCDDDELGCALSSFAEEDFALCRPLTGTASEGQVCDAHGDCGSALVCVTTSDLAVCRSFCVDDGDCDGAFRQCVQLIDPVVVEGRTLGVCL